jgi:methylenetetrahydrofolate--tRNA-(uracil-5-)-methyltransferase
MRAVNVIGGGLAGSEAAYFLASRGCPVRLFEMRPVKNTPVHETGYLAELVCSNSLKSELTDSAQGLLKQEMGILGSLLLDCAGKSRVPAGSALAVDRRLFSRLVTGRIESMKNIEIIREEVTRIPEQGISIIATGPLSSDAMAQELQQLSGKENLFFYDAIAPSVSFESIDLDIVFKASRYGKGSDDYYNCPMNQEEYERFYHHLIQADTFQGHSVDDQMVFEGCMPVEVMAGRGFDTLRFGPLRPVGLKDPRNGKQPYAVVQLRQEDQEARVFGLVGFQTRLKRSEQQKLIRLIPGLERAEIVRYGAMHRNTYINSPQLLHPTLQFKSRPHLLLAGQITGVEGYMESAATGLIAGINAWQILKGQEALVPSPYTLIGSLLQFISNSESKNFQPINANFGLLPPLKEKIKDKKARYRAYVGRSLEEMKKFSELFMP